VTAETTSETTSETNGDAGMSAERFCDHCGQPLSTGSHDRCRALRRLEPPRYCPHCRRRMVVQVVPRGWMARCVEHGESTATNG
jgi:hypothetical protein